MALIIAELRKNKRELIRVSIEPWHGRRLVNLRVWFRAEDGELRPSTKGLAVAIDQAPALAEALAAAIERARGEGLLPAEGAAA